MHATDVPGYLPKLKRGLGLASEAHFLNDFPIKFFLIQYILYLKAKFQCHNFFPSQDIKQNVLLSSYLDGWWDHEL